MLVVEDDNLTRITLASSLKAAGLRRVHTAASINEAIMLAKKYIPQAALIDLHLGAGPTGLDLARQLRALDAKIGIVLLTSYDDPRLLGENPDFIPAGTKYLLKRDITDITAVIEALGAAPGSNKLLGRKNPDAFGTKLSENQLSILKLVAEGLSNTEIARRRGVSEKAIEGTISRLATKLSLEKDAAHNQRVHIARVYFRAMGVNLDTEPSET
ncbi:MAG: response regulator transcription factor [Aurantimicrobium sp.]|uniref:response regulator transcription factor n=1 Tax=Aurantimicrobium TaxID=1705353 RepID=UPI002405BC49|nr:response regulator transcription factor [Aurantimicrobium minutum]